MTGKRFPSEHDPIGTRYVRDDVGQVIVDRREESARVRYALIYVLLGLTLVVSALSFIGVINQGVQDADQRHDTAKTLYEIRLSQREGCDGGNDVRKGLRQFIHDQIDAAKQVDPSLFPDIPPAVFKELTEKRITDYRRNIQENFLDVDCQARYPLLDNPDTDADETGH